MFIFSASTYCTSVQLSCSFHQVNSAPHTINCDWYPLSIITTLLHYSSSRPEYHLLHSFTVLTLCLIHNTDLLYSTPYLLFLPSHNIFFSSIYLHSSHRFTFHSKKTVPNNLISHRIISQNCYIIGLYSQDFIL